MVIIKDQWRRRLEKFLPVVQWQNRNQKLKILKMSRDFYYVELGHLHVQVQ